MVATERSGRTEEQEILLKALYDATKGGERGGVLQPSLFNIEDRTDRLEQLGRDQITRAARKLHREGVVMSEDSFRPRTLNPTIALTPKGWDVLADMGYGLPDEWYDVFDEILETLYEHEKEQWDTPASHTWIYRKQLAEQIDADYAVFDHFISYLKAIEYIKVEHDRSSSQREAYEITEIGAQAYENKRADGESRGFE